MRPARRLPLEELAPYLYEVPDPPVALEWPALFGNSHSVEIEVGFGKGLFLVNAAQTCPQTNFFGIEIVRKYQLYAATRLAMRKLTNIRLAKGDARLILRDCVPSTSVQAVHVYFPDPWWKQRHHKRRVFTAEFAAQCARILVSGGVLHVVTDVEEYFGIMTTLLARLPELTPRPPRPASAPVHDMDYLTNFERKFRKAGKPIWRAAYEKHASA